ncbi:cell division topological specificity factor MinE, partial [Alcanivorax sp.]
YLPQLQQELLMVVRKYVPVGEDAVNVQVDRESGCEILELNITLPEEEAQQHY